MDFFKTRGYDYFSISQPRKSKCRPTGMLVSTPVSLACVRALEHFKEKNEKEPAAISVVGYLNSRSAHRVLDSGDATSRLDSVGKHEKKPGASLPERWTIKSRCTITAFTRT